MRFFYDSTDKRVGFANGTMLFYYLYNLQGDVVAIARAATGQIVATYSYDAWGKCTVTNATGYAVGDKTPFRYRYFAFDVRENSKFRAYLPEINARYAQEKILQSRTVTALAGRIISEFMRGEVCADLLDCLLGEIVVELRRGGAEEKSLEINDGKQAALEARNYIDGHYLELNSLAELSARCGYSYPYLSKIFSASAGMSLRRYFAEKRMEHAKEMLQEGKSVTEAAEALSYNSICNFSRAFKRYFGRPPEAFKPPRG